MTVGLSDKIVSDKRGCRNRPSDALSKPYVVPDGYTANGAKRYRTIRTEWKDADRGLCQFALTNEGKAEPECVGCVWRVKQ